MNKQRLFQIMHDVEIKDILYNDEPVWIQEIKDNMATIGFLNGHHEKDVYIKDLYEDD